MKRQLPSFKKFVDRAGPLPLKPERDTTETTTTTEPELDSTMIMDAQTSKNRLRRSSSVNTIMRRFRRSSSVYSHSIKSPLDKDSRASSRKHSTVDFYLYPDAFTRSAPQLYSFQSEEEESPIGSELKSVEETTHQMGAETLKPLVYTPPSHKESPTPLHEEKVTNFLEELSKFESCPPNVSAYDMATVTLPGIIFEDSPPNSPYCHQVIEPVQDVPSTQELINYPKPPLPLRHFERVRQKQQTEQIPLGDEAMRTSDDPTNIEKYEESSERKKKSLSQEYHIVLKDQYDAEQSKSLEDRRRSSQMSDMAPAPLSIRRHRRNISSLQSMNTCSTDNTSSTGMSKLKGAMTIRITNVLRRRSRRSESDSPLTPTSLPSSGSPPTHVETPHFGQAGTSNNELLDRPSNNARKPFYHEIDSGEHRTVGSETRRKSPMRLGLQASSLKQLNFGTMGGLRRSRSQKRRDELKKSIRLIGEINPQHLISKAH